MLYFMVQRIVDTKIPKTFTKQKYTGINKVIVAKQQFNEPG